MATIIDGHNLIGVLPDIHLADPGDEARLLRRLRDHCARNRSGPMIVFFDAGSSGSALRPEQRGAGLAVEARFAAPGQTADDAIVAFLRGVTQPGQYAVVTDDRELTWRVRALGASTIRASEFAARLAPQAKRASPKAGHAGTIGELAPDPHAPVFADLYAGFIAAEKSSARFTEGVAADAGAWAEKLYTEEPGEAQRAARWLGQYGGTEALEPLQDAVTHSDVRVRAAALLALADVGDRRALPVLCDRLANDAASLARQAAAQSLGRIGDRSVVSALETAASVDAKSKVRKAARDALDQIRAREPRLRPAGRGGAKPPS
jgi:predicted RNA-binding protein with PIN domain